MCPRGLGERARMVSHVLLLETQAHGLVLVDTGIGVDDVRDPRRLGAFFGPAMGVDATKTKMPARPQLEALGFDPAEVRHIVLTHLDFDHAGGLPDFPHAKVHVSADEKAAALARAAFRGRARYRPAHLAHGPDWELFGAEGEPWNGLPVVRQLAGLPPEILAIPLGGHSRGHAAIAVDTGRGWLVHAGDAYFHRSAIERGNPKRVPLPLRLVERLIAFDYARVRENHARLSELSRREGVTVFSAHDPVEYRRFSGLITSRHMAVQ
jgi:glyoxylase-like metal-dependent hydrolase (beta-lactamase superfamily II)